jgi:DNA-binding NtrC family response regulator
VRGAFTDAKADRVGRFELADGGTLFLDEIANISATQQARLLRVLQTGELERVGSSRTIKVDVRVLSATNADLPAEVEAGRFRADLLYRLNAIEIHLPPLREHREDIAPLASFFLSNYAQKYRKQVSEFDPAAMRAMFEHDWPGNVRELQHAIERAVLLAQGEKIQAADFGLRGTRTPQRMEELSLEQVEALLIRKAMSRYEGNVSKAASALGLSRSALYRRLDRYGIA